MLFGGRGPSVHPAELAREGAVVGQDTVLLVRAGVRKLLDTARAVDAVAARELAGHLQFDYGNLEVREQLEQRQTKVLAPLHLTRTADDDSKVDKDQFTVDPTAGKVTCPEGKTANIQKPRPNWPRADGVRCARFVPGDCGPCAIRERCSPSGSRNIRVSRREDIRQTAMRELADPAELAHLRQTRPRIERLLGLIVHRYHARISRYIGAGKTELQAVWTAVLVFRRLPRIRHFAVSAGGEEQMGPDRT